MIEHPSPNHDSRDGQAIDMLVLHYTGMKTGAEALDRLCDPDAKVSAHYLIEEDGRLFRLVEESRRAWHAGIAHWAGACNINARSIGIELVNPGHEFGYRPFPAAQMTCLITLAKELITRHAIPPHRILGHSDVAPSRKQDPGELFDWAELAANGIGLWPTAPATDRPAPSPEALVPLLQRFGYGVENLSFECLVTAFQRHFQPEAVTGRPDGQTLACLEALVEQNKKTSSNERP